MIYWPTESPAFPDGIPIDKEFGDWGVMLNVRCFRYRGAGYERLNYGVCFNLGNLEQQAKILDKEPWFKGKVKEDFFKAHEFLNEQREK